MGTRGNQPGFKIFSFSTTLRSAQVRNERFLLHFKDYDGLEFKKVFWQYFKEVVSDGTYKFKSKKEYTRYDSTDIMFKTKQKLVYGITGQAMITFGSCDWEGA